MGSWGYTPFENDSAGDWLSGKIMRPINSAIESAGDPAEHTTEREEARAAIEVMIRLELYDPDLLHDAERWLTEMLERDSFDDWKNPRAARESVTKQRDQVRSMLRRARRKKR